MGITVDSKNKRSYMGVHAQSMLSWIMILAFGFLPFTGCKLDFPLEMIPDEDAAVIDASDIDASDVDASDIDASDVDASDIDASDIDAATNECGNGIIEDGEECDDGNTDDGDGCDSNCQIEHGWYCEGEPSVCHTICGDGIVAGDEECDDGNDIEGDGCNNNCEIDCSNLSTTDCNPDGETLNPNAAFVDKDPPEGFVQCAGFRNTTQNDVAAHWEANCLGETRTLRIRYWDTSQTPWELLGDATLDPASGAAYETQVFDATNHGGSLGVFENGGVTMLKDDPGNGMISRHVCYETHPVHSYAASDMYLGTQDDNQTLMVCGFSVGDGVGAICSSAQELMLVDVDYSINEGCENKQPTGITSLAIAIYFEL